MGTPCASPTTYTELGDGVHTVTVVATDESGARGQAFARWTVDATPPTVNLFKKPPPFTNQPTAEFAWSADEWPVTYTCALDLESPQTCTSPTSYGPLSDGLHSFTLTGTDKAGNVSVVPAWTWVQDRTGPVLTLSGGPPKFTNINTWTWTFTTEEPATFKCKKDGATYYNCISPFVWTMSDGAHSLSVFAVDLAGNVGNIVTESWTVDRVKPTASITSPKNGATVSGTVTVSATATDNTGVAKVELLVDGVVNQVDAEVPYSFSWDTRTKPNGRHTLVARSWDAAGNSKTSTVVAVTVDNHRSGPAGSDQVGLV
jgi:hypothetical protein